MHQEGIGFLGIDFDSIKFCSGRGSSGKDNAKGMERTLRSLVCVEDGVYVMTRELRTRSLSNNEREEVVDESVLRYTIIWVKMQT